MGLDRQQKIHKEFCKNFIDSWMNGYGFDSFVRHQHSSQESYLPKGIDQTLMAKANPVSPGVKPHGTLRRMNSKPLLPHP